MGWLDDLKDRDVRQEKASKKAYKEHTRKAASLKPMVRRVLKDVATHKWGRRWILPHWGIDTLAPDWWQAANTRDDEKINVHFRGQCFEIDFGDGRTEKTTDLSEEELKGTFRRRLGAPN